MANLAKEGVPPVFGGSGVGSGGNVAAAAGLLAVSPTPPAVAAKSARTLLARITLPPDADVSPVPPRFATHLGRPGWPRHLYDHWLSAHGSDNSQTDAPSHYWSEGYRSTHSSETGPTSSSWSLSRRSAIAHGAHRPWP